MRRHARVLVDSREKKPLPIPGMLSFLDDAHPATRRRRQTVRIQSETRELKTGDYVLEGHEREVVVERKGAVSEILQNTLTKDRTRFVKALDRLASESTSPWVIMEGTPVDMVTPTRWCPDPHLACDSLQRLLLERSIGLILVPTKNVSQRRAAGEFVARLLVNGAHTAWPSSPTPSKGSDSPPEEPASAA